VSGAVAASEDVARWQPRSGLLRWADLTPVPWKNAGGVTRELAGAPTPSGPDGFSWRVSLAEVGHDGAFSVFPGVDRVITVVDGAGMALTVDGERHVVRPTEPFTFAGDSDTLGSLTSGSVTNLNVMTLRGFASAEVELLDVVSGAELAVEADVTAMVLAVAGDPAVRVLGREPVVSLGRLDSWWQPGPARLAVTGSGAALVARMCVR
jgi:environmental stress-induced protein Ves